MEEYKKEMLMVSAILFKNNVPVEEAKPIGAFIEKLIEENQQLKDKLESNWKTLKEWLIEQRKYYHGEDKYGDTLDKMNELEKEND